MISACLAAMVAAPCCQLTEPAPVASPGAEIVVQDASGSPVEGAVLVRADARRRFLVFTPSATLASSDRHGRMQVAPADGALVVYKAGVGAAPVTDLEAGSTRMVTLGAGSRVEVRCRLDGHRPLAGVRVTLSRVPFENVRGAVPTEEWCPGVHPAFAVFSAVTDRDGIAEVPDVPAGGYVIEAWAERHVCVDGISNRELFAVPHSGAAELVFAELAGAAVRLKDDEVYAVGQASGFASCPLVGSVFLSVQRRLVEEAHPDATVLLGIRGDELLAVQLFSARRGPFSLPVRAEALPLGATTVVEDRALPPAVRTGTLTLLSDNPDDGGPDASSFTSGFALSTLPFEGGGLSLRFGVPYVLPENRYAIGVDDSVSTVVAPPSEVEVSAGKEAFVRVRRPEGLVPIRVSVVPPWEGAMPSGLLSLTAGGKTLHKINWRGLPDVFWVGEGPLVVRFSCYGLGAIGRFEVRPGKGLQQVALSVDLQEGI